MPAAPQGPPPHVVHHADRAGTPQPPAPPAPQWFYPGTPQFQPPHHAAPGGPAHAHFFVGQPPAIPNFWAPAQQPPPARLQPPVAPIPQRLPPVDKRRATTFINRQALDRRRVLDSLHPGELMVDEVYDDYVKLLRDRARLARQPHWALTTLTSAFLYSDDSYSRVAACENLGSGTEKINLFNYSTVSIPIYTPNHWHAVVVNMKQRRIEYFDSFHGPTDAGNTRQKRIEFSEAAVRSLLSHHADHLALDMDIKSWTFLLNEDSPRQEGPDCGIFMTQTIEMVMRGRDLVAKGFEFKAAHMGFFRSLMRYEIATGGLRNRDEWAEVGVDYRQSVERDSG
ncbi:hypothetical protein B9479_002711 [Cryptococcus floricola]|uniref:Ubiquitin-like protease family profile domain-containing protein n=1 Tax=Cryptococcus floricola TaxID=2591691 RepID=A0A5D3B258_9TREE|nr:hypothetical protein B9479_002711 [Cryptococcus floricola]